MFVVVKTALLSGTVGAAASLIGSGLSVGTECCGFACCEEDMPGVTSLSVATSSLSAIVSGGAFGTCAAIAWSVVLRTSRTKRSFAVSDVMLSVTGVVVRVCVAQPMSNRLPMKQA